MTKKPKQVEPQEPSQEVLSALTVEGNDTVFMFTDTTYASVWNEKEDRYDLLTIRINSETNECVIDKREATRYDTSYRALDDVIKKVTNLYIKGEE